MKLMNKKLFAMMALLSLSAGGNLFAHAWKFTNKTKEPLVLRFGLQGQGVQAQGNYYYNIVQPGATASFDMWGSLAGLFMAGVDWAKYDPNMKVAGVTQNGGLDMYPAGHTLVGPEFGKLSYQYKPLKTQCVTNEAAQKIQQANVAMFGEIGMLDKGVASLASGSCSSTNEGKSFTILKTNDGELVAIYQ